MSVAAAKVQVRWRPLDTAGGWQYKDLAPGEGSVRIDGLERGVEYQFEARSVSITGAASEWVGQSHIVDSTATPPLAPTINPGVSLADGVHLSWTVTDSQRTDTEYQVQRTNDVSGAPNEAGWADLVRIRALAYTDGVTDGVVRWYRVRAITYLGVASAWSSEVNSRGKVVADGATVGAVLGPGGNVSGAVDANLRPIIDFTQPAHISKNLDNIADGSSFGRPILSRLSAGKPLIDFSESIHLNKTLTNIPDGGARFAVAAVDANKKALIDFSQGGHLNKTLDNVGDSPTYIRIPNAPTNRNLISDSGFKTWNSNALYWVPSAWVLLPGMGQDGGNAIGYLGTGAASGFPEAGLRKAAILLAPGNYTLSAFMDATFMTTQHLDMGLYWSVYPGTPSAVQGGLVHLVQTPGAKGRVFINFTVSIKTWAPSTSFNPGDLIIDTHGNLQVMNQISAGVSGSSAPTWATTLNGTTVDGGINSWLLINLATNMLGGTKVPFNLLLFPSNAIVTSGKYVLISNPQLEPTPPSNTPTPYKENNGDDTTGTMLIDFSSTLHGNKHLDPSTSEILKKGSMPVSLNSGLSWSSNTTSITWGGSSFALTGFRTDASLTPLSIAVNQAVTGLSSATSYNHFPFLDEGTSLFNMVTTGGVGTPAWAHVGNSQAWTAEQARQDHLPLSLKPVPASTTSSGTGGGSDPGSGTCPREDMKVEHREWGVITTGTLADLWKELPEHFVRWRNEWVRVVCAIREPNSRWIEIAFDCGESFVGTPGHAWSLMSGEIKQSHELTVESPIPWQNGGTYPRMIRIIEAKADAVMIRIDSAQQLYNVGAEKPVLETHNGNILPC